MMPLIPNLITTGNLFFGLLSIMTSIQVINTVSGDNFDQAFFFRKYWWAAAFIGISAFLDMLDGKLARIIRSESKFGVSYDSLSDLVSFGIAPAILVYTWTLIDYGKLALMVVLFYVVCTALRLARFNIQSDNIEKYKFSGLPSPMAAGVIASPVLLFCEINILPNDLTMWAYLVLAPIIGILMVSDIPYWKFPRRIKSPFNALVTLSIITAAIMTVPEFMILIIAYTYTSAGLIIYLIRLLRKKQPSEEHVESESFRIF